LGNSIVYATTSEVGISTPSPTHPLDVNGRVRVRTIDSTATGMNMLYADPDGVIKKTAIPAGGSGTVTSVAAGTGMSFSTITTTGSVSADTVALSTRAWRQKGIDSVNANVALKVNISDTATMLSPYVRTAGFGLTKGTQTLSVDSATMATRARVQKGIDSVAGLARITGSGTTNYIPRFTGTTSLGNSQITDGGTTVGIGTTTSLAKLTVSTGGIGSETNGIGMSNGAQAHYWYLEDNTTSRFNVGSAAGVFRWSNSNGILAQLSSNAELLINTTTSTAGGYKLQVAGSIYNTTGAVLAATSGNVGIGTTSPSSKFEVYGTAASAVIAATITNATNGQAGLTLAAGSAGNNAATRIDFLNRNTSTTASRWILINDFSQNGTNDFNIVDASIARQFTILQGGNTGIGTTSPSERLHVNGRARIVTIDSSASPSNMLWADATGVVRKAAVPSGGSGTVTSVSAGTGMSFTTITTTGSVAVDTLSIATRARLYKTIDSMKAVGDVNVYNTNGTLTANRTITKGGFNLTLKGDVGEFAVENAAGTNKVAVTNDAVIATGTSLTLFAPSAQPLIMSSGNGEAARFTSNKDLGIGTTSPSERLHVNGGNIRSDGKIYIKSNLDENTAFENSALTMGYNSTDSVGWIQAKAISYSGAKLVLNAEGGNVFVNTNGGFGSYSFQVNGVGYFDGGIRTGTGTGVTPATWKLGSRVATTGLTLSTTEYLEVNIGGTSYQIALVN
jgi:hypothetical protein